MPAPEEKDPRTDEEIFLEAMGGVREIPSYRDLPGQSKAGKFKRKGRADSSIDELKDIVEQRADINISDTDEYDEWVPQGQSAGLARKLHKGECAIQDFIDLHGFKEAGAEAELVDAVAREPIAKAGRGEQFGHGTGHGVGLEVHEEPRVAPGSKDRLGAGNVVTVEPGVYVPGRFGVRIENLVAVERQGSRLLTHAPRELVTV
ncbi:hypothetical protein LCGC14_2934570 [marine sediment metagenome]|uniref:Peptidase M24 domain-containing protein n=1 Tax=marine sediment metagenome TaxID=412755 RepID=A0A0F9AAZ0_9ZZZZ